MLHAKLRIQQQALESEQTTGFTEGILEVTEKIILIICNIVVYSVLLLPEHRVKENQGHNLGKNLNIKSITNDTSETQQNLLWCK
jgi:hypothetical protein